MRIRNFGRSVGMVLKAPVAAVSSIYGSIVEGLARPLNRAHWGAWIRESHPGAWQDGAPTADPLGGLTANSAIYACIARISNDIASLPMRLMRREASGVWVEAPGDLPEWGVIRTQNQYQDPSQFVAYWECCKLIFGNAYGLKVRDASGLVVRIHPLDPRTCTPLVTPIGDVYYQISSSDLAGIPSGITVPASEVIHDRINCLFHPLVGIPPIYACAIAATQGNRIQSNSTKFFSNMSRPSGMLTAPGKIQHETAERLKRTFEENYSGRNLGRLFVAGDDLKYEALTIPPEQAQLVQQFDMTVADVARAFHMPLYKLQSGGQLPTSSNVQALQQQYYNECLRPAIEALEMALDRGLGLHLRSGPRLRVELDVDAGLFRMDSLTLADVVQRLTQAGVMAPNEGRFKFNLSPTTGGESPLMQQQNFSLAALARRDASPDPFATSAQRELRARVNAMDKKAKEDRLAEVRVLLQRENLQDAQRVRLLDERDALQQGGSWQ